MKVSVSKLKKDLIKLRTELRRESRKLDDRVDRLEATKKMRDITGQIQAEKDVDASSRLVAAIKRQIKDAETELLGSWAPKNRSEG